MAKVLGILAIAVATYLALQLHAGRTRQAVEALPPELAAPAPPPDRPAPPAPGGARRPMRLGDGVRERVEGYMAQEAARQPR